MCNGKVNEVFEGLTASGRALSPCCEPCANETKADHGALQVEAPPPVKSIEEQIEERFACAKCEHTICRTRRIATTGTGLSKLLDIQHNEFIVVSCQKCGTIELLDPNVLEDSSNTLSNVLDYFFG